MDKNDYFLNRKIKTLKKLESIVKNLPDFCQEYFIGIENTTSPLTRMNYAVDLSVFFDFLSIKYELPIKKMQLKLLDMIVASDIEQFLSYLSGFEFNNQHHTCDEKAKARKLASIRSLFKYFFNKDKIIANTAAKVSTPKLHDKEIIRLENNEVVELLDNAKTGKGFTKHQIAYQKQTTIRDSALLTLFLGTGIRISELVGLNVDDIFFDNNSFVVTRKGGNRTILYYNDEVKSELIRYCEHRKTIKDLDKNELALFLSIRNTRLSVRAVEELVKKYAKIVTPLKKITPHKLRSTFGTNLYRETGDIYVVADILGHKDVNTTKKHYAAVSDDLRKKAVTKVNYKDNQNNDENDDN